MAYLHQHLGIAESDLGFVRLGSGPSPVRRLSDLGGPAELWIKDEAAYGDGGWGGNKVRKLEWIIPEAHRRGQTTLFTVGGIGTHWGLAAALYGREHGLRTILGLMDQPVDDHVREQLARLNASDAVIHRYRSKRRLIMAAPWLLARYSRRLRPPYFLPAGGSSPVGALGYVETAFEIAEQVATGDLPEPGTIVMAVGSGGTAAGLALGLRLAGLQTKVFGVVVNDTLRLDALAIRKHVQKTKTLLRDRGAQLPEIVLPADHITMSSAWLGDGYGHPTPEGLQALKSAAEQGLELEPVYTAKALAAVLQIGPELDQPVLFLQTHGPR